MVSGHGDAWSRHALVLVDLQHDFWSASVAAANPALPERVAALLADARAVGLAVLHVRSRFQSDRSDWMARYRLGDWIPCIGGTPGAATLPFAAELPDEPVVIKHTFDGFIGTELDDLLTRRGIRSVLIAGLVTSTCVLFTAAAAMQRGYLASVVTDCCADRPEDHDATLARYRFVFDLVRSDEIVARRAAWEADLNRMVAPHRLRHGSPSIWGRLDDQATPEPPASSRELSPPASGSQLRFRHAGAWIR